MSMKTSATHPIQIATVSYGEQTNSVGITLCPGKKGPSSFGGSWDRDLDIDLSAIKWGFNPRIIITLMTREELVLSKVSDIGQKIENLGIQWLHLPIADMTAPGRDFENAWPDARRLILQTLDREQYEHGNVLVHCRGGLGRSGVLAAMILTELGMRNKTALWAVRKERPGAVETKEQEDYVLKYLPTLLVPNFFWWPKSMYAVSQAVDRARNYINHSEFNGEVIQDLERREVQAHEVLRMIDETVYDFEHYIEDIGVQINTIIAALGISAKPFPTNIESWLSWLSESVDHDENGGYSGHEGYEWCLALQESMNRALRQTDFLEESDRVKIRGSYGKIIRYLSEWVSRTENRERHEWWSSIASSSFGIPMYLKVLIDRDLALSADNGPLH